MENNPSSRISLETNDIIKYLLVIFFIFSAIISILINSNLLILFSNDGILNPKTLIRINLAQKNTLIFTIFLVFCYFLTNFKYFKSFISKSERSQNIILVITPLIYCIIIAEILLRISPQLSTKELMEQSVAYDISPLSRHRLSDYDHDVLLINDNLKKEIKMKIRDGYRGEYFPKIKEEDEIRIFVMGGSQIFDQEALLSEDWPHIIQKNLQQNNFSNIRVINAGVPGHSTFDSFAKILSEIRLFSPDYIILCHTHNEFLNYRNMSISKTPLRIMPSLSSSTYDDYSISLIEKIAEKSQIYLRIKYFGELIDLKKRYKEKMSRDLNEFVTGDAYEQMELNINMFIDLCKRIDANPILLTQASAVTPGNFNSSIIKNYLKRSPLGMDAQTYYESFKKADSLIKEIASKRDILFLDISNTHSGKLDYFVDAIHFNRKGSYAIAKSVSDYLGKVLNSKR
tara:strand:+ start:271 stop:1641 length:1371 start_codon:yes stop_codon:yes gene_type:complete